MIRNILCEIYVVSVRFFCKQQDRKTDRDRERERRSHMVEQYLCTELLCFVIILLFRLYLKSTLNFT